MGNEALEKSFQRLQKYGYDDIEFAADPYGLDAERCLELMKEYGIGAVSMCGMFGTAERDLSADDAKTAICYLRDSVDFAAKIGATTIIIVPSPVGRTEPPAGIPFERLWNNAVRNIRCAADYAQSKGIRFVIEAINRYETYFVNTLTKAWKLVTEIDHPVVGIMADTFHMNLEENNFGSVLRMIAPKLWHVHIADNTREPAGMGRTDFKELLCLLRDVDFRGSVAMEFMPRLANPYGSQGMETASDLMDAYAAQAIRHMRCLERGLELTWKEK